MTARSHTQKAGEIIQTIAQAIVDDPEFAGNDWAAIGMVAIIEDGARQLSGYSFDANGKPKPALPENDDIDEMFLQLQQATSVEGKSPWKSALFQIKRDGMRYGVDFEYDNPLRWKTNPAGREAVIESIRPA